jgi:hypothetical protein
MGVGKEVDVKVSWRMKRWKEMKYCAAAVVQVTQF